MALTHTRGDAFVASVTDQYSLAAHAAELLLQAGRLIDKIDALDEVVDRDGVLAVSSQGLRPHPALTEARASRLALHKILISLDLPLPVGG